MIKSIQWESKPDGEESVQEGSKAKHILDREEAGSEFGQWVESIGQSELNYPGLFRIREGFKGSQIFKLVERKD